MGMPPSPRLLLLTRAVNVSRAQSCGRWTSKDPLRAIYSIFNYFILMTTARLCCRRLKANPAQFSSQLPVCQDKLSIQTSSKISLILDSMMLLIRKGHLAAIYSSAQGSISNKNTNKKAGDPATAYSALLDLCDRRPWELSSPLPGESQLFP